MIYGFQIFILLLFAQPILAGIPQKKNLCTVTINSNDEANLFMKRLDPADWNFIELTPENSSMETKNWFQAACKKKIQCDILVISGHFAGSFFGKSKFTLPIEELEMLSCDESCDGILNKPKEVFLFGCNTLATKEKDLRTPEEYMQVLRDDGFTPAQASQVVSFRYSDFGDSFKTRMSSIFPKTPNIYGFNSKGPSGSTVSALLDKYLVNSKVDYKNFENVKSSPAKNEKLFSALHRTTLVQTAGLLPQMKSVDEKPYCYIRSPRINRVEKLKYIENLLQSGTAIQMISHIEDFIRDLKADKSQITSAEQSILTRLAHNEKIKSELISLLKLESEIYIPLKVHILNTLKDLDLVSTTFVESTFNQLIDFRTPFTARRKDMICSSQFTVNIPVEIIPEQRWTEVDFITGLICLRPKNVELHKKMLQYLNSSDLVLRGTIIWFFYGNQAKDLDVQLALAKTLLTDSESSVRHSAALVLRSIKSEFSEVHEMLIRSLAQEQDENIVNSVLNGFIHLKLSPASKALLIKAAATSKFKNLLLGYIQKNP